MITNEVKYTSLDRETARRAHLGTSFSPEKRANQEISGHKEVFEDLQKELGDFFEQKHADKLHQLWTEYLHSHANVMSSMITGPARFPVERNRKKAEWADNKRRAIFEYCDNLKKWKGKSDRRDAIKAAGGELSMTRDKLSKAIEWHETMKKANKIIRSSPRDEITEKKQGDLNALGLDDKTLYRITHPDWCGRLGFPTFELTNSNARIKNTAARVAELERRESAKEAGSEAREVKIPGGKVFFDSASNRINVKHDEKPPREIIDIVKAHGFKWSRNYGHWTRKMTSNAMYRANSLIETLNSQAVEA